MSPKSLGSSCLIGSSDVDLSTLRVLGEVSGWYNILNENEVPCGQIKVRAPQYHENAKPCPFGARFPLSGFSAAITVEVGMICVIGNSHQTIPKNSTCSKI